MATFQITKVHTVRPYGAAHDHIDQVELNGDPSFRISRTTVVNDLRNVYGDRYFTLGGGVRADVILAACPHCGSHDYITTAPDWTTANNLLSLPRF